MEITLFGVAMSSWQIFVCLGLIFCVLEISAPGLVFLPVGIALFITAIVSLFITEPEYQLLVLGGLLVVVFYIFKKMVKPQFRDDHLVSNADSMVGKKAEVIKEINSHGGYVKLYGDKWRAVPASDDMVVKVGEKVTIKAVDGNKVVVEL